MTAEVLTLFLLNTLFFLFATLAFVIAVRISRAYNSSATTPQQYRLEEESYLASTVVKYIFFIKIPLFLFFVFTLEKLSLVLPGAMCAAGVVNASEYGISLFILKIINLYLFAFWLLLHKEDMKKESAPFMRLKFQIFLPLYIFLVVEIVLELLFFLSLDVGKVVDCCGVVFSSSDGTYIAEIIGAPFWFQLLAVYFLLFLLFTAYRMKNKTLFSLINFFFLFVALLTIIGAFSPYIYELPTHHCPFCLLAHDYNYIGYLLYTVLFLGTFYGGVLAFIPLEQEREECYYKRSLFFNTLYLGIVSYYILLYYLKNSVLL